MTQEARARATRAIGSGGSARKGSEADGRRQRRLWETKARLWLRWLGEEEIRSELKVPPLVHFISR